MTSRDLLQVKSFLDGPVWRYIKERMQKEIYECRANGSRHPVSAMVDLVSREQLCMRANALEEFLTSLPSQIQSEYKEQLEKEQATSNE